MFERFTESARRTLFFARYEASQLGSLSIETEHLLLGLTREPGSPIVDAVFAKGNLTRETIREDVQSHTTPREILGDSVEIPFSAGTKRVLQHAGAEADRLKHNDIASEHLLLGILVEDGGVAASVLSERGMRLDTVRADVVNARNES